MATIETLDIKKQDSLQNIKDKLMSQFTCNMFEEYTLTVGIHSEVDYVDNEESRVYFKYGNEYYMAGDFLYNQNIFGNKNTSIVIEVEGDCITYEGNLEFSCSTHRYDDDERGDFDYLNEVDDHYIKLGSNNLLEGLLQYVGKEIKLTISQF